MGPAGAWQRRGRRDHHHGPLLGGGSFPDIPVCEKCPFEIQRRQQEPDRRVLRVRRPGRAGKKTSADQRAIKMSHLKCRTCAAFAQLQGNALAAGIGRITRGVERTDARLSNRTHVSVLPNSWGTL